ncbi:MAG TPA: TonB family protein [Burkholderiales bacterium]|nr:TonB family protein [Burkholderiales bacterium]
MSERREPGKWRSGILSVLVHLFFLGFLLLSVNWQLKDEAPQEVTLWNSIPEVKPVQTPKVRTVHHVEPSPPVPKPAPAVTPPPAVLQKAEIALRQKRKKEALAHALAVEQARQKKLARLQEEKSQKAARQAALKKKQAEEAQKALEARKAAKEAAMKAKLKREAQINAQQQAFVRRQIMQEQASLEQAQAQASAAANKKILNEYVRRIRDKIRANEDLPAGLDPDSAAMVHVTLLPTGEVINISLLSSTGTKAYADAVERAIYKAQPLPLPPQPALIEAFKNIDLKFTLKEDSQQ